MKPEIEYRDIRDPRPYKRGVIYRACKSSRMDGKCILVARCLGPCEYDEREHGPKHKPGIFRYWKIALVAMMVAGAFDYGLWAIVRALADVVSYFHFPLGRM